MFTLNGMVFELVTTNLKDMKSVLMFIILVVGIICLCTSCRNPGQPAEEEFSGQPAAEGFYYYPSKNIYYDVKNKHFLYSLDGARTWMTFVGNNNKAQEYLGEEVIIRSANGEVYKENEAHRKSHRGVLLHILDDDSSAQTQAAEVSERKIGQKKRPVIKQEARVKSKKGIGKFFHKIFGKKK
jgi:hypothetical protein